MLERKVIFQKRAKYKVINGEAEGGFLAL